MKCISGSVQRCLRIERCLDHNAVQRGVVIALRVRAIDQITQREVGLLSKRCSVPARRGVQSRIAAGEDTAELRFINRSAFKKRVVTGEIEWDYQTPIMARWPSASTHGRSPLIWRRHHAFRQA